MTEKMRGNLIVISGFSGSGKSSIRKGLLEKADNYCSSISVTTRAPRENEKEGKDYFFVSRNEFDFMKKKGLLLESTEYCGNLYGTPKTYVLSKLSEERDVVLVVEEEGALYIKQIFPDAILIFVIPPSIGELRLRFERRGDSPELIAERMASMKEEALFIPKYDYLVENKYLDKSIELVHNIVITEKMKTSRNLGRIENFLR